MTRSGINPLRAGIRGCGRAAVWKAGKHVLVEKPLALTLEDADCMVEEAEKAAAQSIERGEPVGVSIH